MTPEERMTPDEMIEVAQGTPLHIPLKSHEWWSGMAELCARLDEIIKRLPEPEPEGEE